MINYLYFFCMKVLVDHLDHPYSKCLLELQNQEHVDAYQEAYKTNYTTQVPKMVL